MILKVEDFTNAIKRLQSTIKDIKAMPGVLIDLTEDKFDVCYTDSKVAYIEKLEPIREEGDISEKIVVNYDELVRVLSNCQPSNGIAVKGFRIIFNESTIADIEVEQGIMSDDNTEFSKRGVKRFKLPFKVFNTADRRMALLSRVDYNSIIEANGVIPDKWNRKRLAKIMNTLCESDQLNTPMYFSSKIQWAYTLTNAYTIAFPLEPLSKPTQEEINEAHDNYIAEGLTEEEATRKANLLGKQQTSQMITTSQMGKMIYNVLSKMNCDDVYMYTKDNFIYILNDNGTIGCQFETGKRQNNATFFDTYRSIDYDKANLTFSRNFLFDILKTASNNSGDTTVNINFESGKNEDDENIYKMIFNVSDKQKNIRDKYELEIEGCTAKEDEEGKSVLESMKFVLNLSIFNTIVSQMDSEYIGMDFSETQNNTIYLRVSDIDRDKFMNTVKSKMEELGRELTFNEKIELRKEYLGTTAFILIKEK